MSGFQLRTVAVLSAAVLYAGVAVAQDPAPSRLSVHGYLTQAYGQNDQGLLMGLSREGTSDYRRAAVVARYAATPKDALVVQLAHRRLGDSPTMEFEDESVKLDMAFYERRFDTGTRIRVGKSVIPFGIFNEVRYAGTLLPFYRVPFALYQEGHYTSETIDGLVVTQRFRSGETWETSLDVYGGNFEILEFGTVQTSPTSAAYLGAVIQAKNALGGQLWVSTPVDGLRLGTGFRTEEHFGGLYARPNGITATSFSGSVDGSFERWQARAEGIRIKTFGALVHSAYAQVGVRPVTRLGFNVQSEGMNIKTPSLPDPIENIRDTGVGLNFYLSPQTVLKLEYHKARGHWYEQVSNPAGPPTKSSYFISSFSVAF